MEKIFCKFKSICIVLLVVAFGFWSCKQTKLDFDYQSEVPSHHLLDSLLTLYIDEKGWVDYPGVKQDSMLLNEYLESLKANPPDTNTWSREEQMAYWINAYNAFTIQLITDNYPLKSIKDLNPSISIPFVNSIWDVQFIDIGNTSLSLNNIEHDILRGHFKESRIHFVINCASISCPRLLNKAYVPETLDSLMDKQADEFINDESKNLITENRVQVSKIFLWFGKDFKRDGTLIDYLNRYADVNIKNSAQVDYMAYNWLLNSQ